MNEKAKRTNEDNADGGAMVDHDKEKEQILESISWQELIFIVNQKWGLRHVNNIDAAKKEMKNGIEYGDAVSLSYPNNFFPPDISKYQNFDKLKKLYKLETLSFNVLAPSIPEEYKENVLISFEKAVKNFIKSSIALDINSTPSLLNLKTETILNILTSTRLAFVLAKFQGADNPYDFSAYYNLGKCGKQKVSPEKIVALVSLQDSKDKIIIDLNFSSDELEENLSKKKFGKIIDVCVINVWNEFLAIAKKNIKS